MLTYLPAAIAFWVAIDWLVVLWLGAAPLAAQPKTKSRPTAWNSAARRRAPGP